MDTATLSILCNEFSRLPAEKQIFELGNLFSLVETNQEFRTRTFQGFMEIHSDKSGYQEDFLEDMIIPMLISDFEESTSGKQKRLLEELSKLVDESSFTIRRFESRRDFRVRCYSEMLQNLRAGSEYRTVEILRKISDSHESDEDEPDRRRGYSQYDSSSDEDSEARSKLRQLFILKGAELEEGSNPSDQGSLDGGDIAETTELRIVTLKIDHGYGDVVDRLKQIVNRSCGMVSVTCGEIKVDRNQNDDEDQIIKHFFKVTSKVIQESDTGFRNCPELGECIAILNDAAEHIEIDPPGYEIDSNDNFLVRDRF